MIPVTKKATRKSSTKMTVCKSQKWTINSKKNFKKILISSKMVIIMMLIMTKKKI